MAKSENTDPNAIAHEVVGASSQSAKLMSYQNSSLVELLGLTPEGYLTGTYLRELASYVMWKSGSTYYAKNGITGEVDYSGTDFKTVIQAAVDDLDGEGTGGTIHLMPGTYSIASKAGFSLKDDMILEGEGPKTVISLDAATSYAINMNGDDIAVRDLKITGTFASNAYYYGVGVVAAKSRLLVDNVQIDVTGGGNGMYFGLTSDLAIRNCVVSNSNKYGIWSNKNTNVRITNNVVRTTTNTGIYSTGDTGLTMFGNNVYGPFGTASCAGIYVNNASSLNGVASAVFGNTVYFPSEPSYINVGIAISGEADNGQYNYGVSVFGNTVYGYGALSTGCAVGMYLHHGASGNVQGVSVNGNTIKDFYTGISVSGYDISLVGNTCKGVKKGIWVFFGRRGTIAGNTLYGVSKADATYVGVSLADAQYMHVTGNYIEGFETGIDEVVAGYTSGNYNTAQDNRIVDCTTMATKAGANSIFRYNFGYVTENSGTSTGTGAEQTIPHGLSTTPTDVQLSNHDMAGCPPYESSAADATNIYVTGVLDKTYRWRVWAE